MKYNPSIVIAFFREHGIPKPELEFKFHPERKWRFDFAWIEDCMPVPPICGNTALEVEGGVWIGGGHVRGSGFVKDMEKYNAAAVLGWRVLRCQPQDLCTMQTVEMIKRCLSL